MKNLIKATSFFNKENDMWVWIGTNENGSKSYNWMHGDDYETFTKEYCKPDEVLTYFIRSISMFSGDHLNNRLDNDAIIELIWIFVNLARKIEEINMDFR
jgi:hypothetical protein